MSTGQGFGGFNMFAYCQNNPVMFVDPSGNIRTSGYVGALLGFANFMLDNFATSGMGDGEFVRMGIFFANAGR